MKKIIPTLAAFLACSSAMAQDGNFPVDSVTNPSLSYLSVSAAVGYESQYMFRGVKYGGHSIQPKVDFAYPILGFDVYAGAWSNQPVKTSNESNLKEFDFYSGVTYSYEMFKADVGYIYYWYPDFDSSDSRDMEVYIGFSMDTASFLGGININPSIYYSYSWIVKQQTIEVSVGYDTPIGEWTMGWENVTLPVNLYCGYASSGRMNGDSGASADEGKTWWYLGMSMDVAVAVTEYCTISAGCRYSWRDGGNEGSGSSGYELQGRENNFWLGGRVEFGF